VPDWLVVHRGKVRQFWKLTLFDTIVVLCSHAPTAAHVAARKAAPSYPTHNQRFPVVGKRDSLQVKLKTPNVAAASIPPLSCARLTPPWVVQPNDPKASVKGV
jgi:hypothetical protein